MAETLRAFGADVQLTRADFHARAPRPEPRFGDPSIYVAIDLGRTRWHLKSGPRRERQWDGLAPCDVVLRGLQVLGLQESCNWQRAADNEAPQTATVVCEGAALEMSEAAFRSVLGMIEGRAHDVPLRELLQRANVDRRLDFDMMPAPQRAAFLGCGRVAFGREGGPDLFRVLRLLPEFRTPAGCSVERELRSAAARPWSRAEGERAFGALLRAIPRGSAISPPDDPWPALWEGWRGCVAVMWRDGPLVVVFDQFSGLARIAKELGLEVIRARHQRVAAFSALPSTVELLAGGKLDWDADWSSFSAEDLAYAGGEALRRLREPRSVQGPDEPPLIDDSRRTPDAPGSPTLEGDGTHGTGDATDPEPPRVPPDVQHVSRAHYGGLGLNDLVGAFRAAAIGNGKHFASNARRAKVEHARVTRIYAELDSRNASEAEMSTPLEDPDPWVRVWAADFHARFDPHRALAVVSAEVTPGAPAESLASSVLMSPELRKLRRSQSRLRLARCGRRPIARCTPTRAIVSEVLDVRFLWLLPITKAERDPKVRHGLEALEERLEAAAFDYLDPLRASVI